MTSKISNRFDFEQQLMECWRVTDDVNVIYEAVMEQESLTKDDIANLLLGVKCLYELKFERLWASFEHGVKEKRIT